MSPSEYRHLSPEERKAAWGKLSSVERETIMAAEGMQAVQADGAKAFQYPYQFRDHLRKHSCFDGARLGLDLLVVAAVLGAGITVFLAMEAGDTDWLWFWAAGGGVLGSIVLRLCGHAALDMADAVIAREHRRSD